MSYAVPPMSELLDVMATIVPVLPLPHVTAPIATGPEGLSQ